MPVNQKYLAPFEFEQVYHVYSRTNNKKLLFRNNENYYYFLRQYDKYISGISDTYAWNLQPNHFHFLLRIKSEAEILSRINSLTVKTKSEKLFLTDKNINNLVEMHFSRFLTSYAMSFNKIFERTGNLFQRTFKRIRIEKDSQFTQALIYVHANAQKHKLVKDFRDYIWTSYHTMISDKPTRLLRTEILEWFGGKEAFIKVHKAMTDYYYNFPGAMEDDE